jgi:uncharacterized protein
MVDLNEPSSKKIVARRWYAKRRWVYPILYMLVLAGGYMLNAADRLLLIPKRAAILLSEATHRPVAFDQGSIDVLVTQNREARLSEPTAFVLEFVGNATQADEVAEVTATEWRPHAVEVWSVNYPGYGKSTGPARLKSVARSALTAYDELRTVAGDRPIVIQGTSIGTTVAMHVAANRKVDGLLLINPPPLQRMILQKHGWWNAWLIAVPVALAVPNELNSLTNGPKLTAPAVFVTSSMDEVVPFKYQQMVESSYAGEKRVIERKTGGHNDPFDDVTGKQVAEAKAWLLERAAAK